VVIMAMLVEIVLIVNCLGMVFESHFDAYLLGVLFPLGVAVAMFIRAIFAYDADERDLPPPNLPG